MIVGISGGVWRGFFGDLVLYGVFLVCFFFGVACLGGIVGSWF